MSNDKLQGFIVGPNPNDELKRLRAILTMPDKQERSEAIKTWCAEGRERASAYADTWIYDVLREYE